MTPAEREELWDQPIDWDAYRALAFALLDDRGEVQCKDAEEDSRPRSAEEADATAGEDEKEA